MIFHDDVFTPNTNSQSVDVELIDDKAPSSTVATKISPALKRKAVTEATKIERFVSMSRRTPNLMHKTPRVKRAKDIKAARMNPTMKKPSGKRSGNGLPITTANKQTVTVMTQDEDETDYDVEEESEDIKPAAGSLRRSSSVRYSKSA